MARPGTAIGGFVTLIIVAALAAFLYFKFWWVFSDGTKTGELNSLTYTGYVFKTYEGEIILTGYGSKTFKFSVADKEVAKKLNQMTGLRVTVHYKEYKGALPWRGYEKAVVDSVSEDAVISDHELTEDDFFL